MQVFGMPAKPLHLGTARGECEHSPRPQLPIAVAGFVFADVPTNYVVRGGDIPATADAHNRSCFRIDVFFLEHLKPTKTERRCPNATAGTADDDIVGSFWVRGSDGFLLAGNPLQHGIQCEDKARHTDHRDGRAVPAVDNRLVPMTSVRNSALYAQRLQRRQPNGDDGRVLDVEQHPKPDETAEVKCGTDRYQNQPDKAAPKPFAVEPARSDQSPGSQRHKYFGEKESDVDQQRKACRHFRIDLCFGSQHP